MIEQQEAANEELQSSNEEVQSANEELQSINEELETSKEEIQSSNEELATVNEELQNRNGELGQSNNDFINLLASVQLPIVMLGPDFRIRRFTPMAEKLLNLTAADMGRPISDLQLGIGLPHLGRMLTEVMETVSVKETEVRDKEGRWYVLRLRPYRTLDHRIDGAVLALLDVDLLKRSQEALRRQNELSGSGARGDLHLGDRRGHHVLEPGCGGDLRLQQGRGPWPKTLRTAGHLSGVQRVPASAAAARPVDRRAESCAA